MSIDRGWVVWAGLSLLLAIVYVVVPTVADPKVNYGEFAGVAHVVSFAYFYAGPALVGIVGALALTGKSWERSFRLVLALVPPILVGAVLWGREGLASDSFRIGMVFLAFVSGLYLLAGVLTCFVLLILRRKPAPR